MSKRFRGKGIVNLVGRGKGVCPVCGRKSVKILWEHVGEDGKNIKVCKMCKNHK
jgi:RNA polymerase subunit RPABC4/transcription elongation factor Spt4